LTTPDNKDFNEQNRKILLDFMTAAEKNDDDISGSIIATISQFLLNMRVSIYRKAGKEMSITPFEIIQSQIDELRRCVIDLEAYKERLTKGVTHQ
jgi:hypothetical protein